MRAGDAELTPSGTRVLRLEGFALDDDLWAKLVCSLADGDDRRRRADKGRRLVLDRHTYAHRSAAVVEFLQTA